MSNPASWLIDILFGSWIDARTTRRVEAEQRVRMAEMMKDPRKVPFVERMKRGEYWWDHDVEYNIDPDSTNVCAHLRPVEQLMRRSGYPLRMHGPLHLRAECRVDPVRFAREVEVGPTVQYVEMPFKDRSMLDPDIAFITCNECSSGIEVVHADSATAETPWFPV